MSSIYYNVAGVLNVSAKIELLDNKLTIDPSLSLNYLNINYDIPNNQIIINFSAFLSTQEEITLNSIFNIIFYRYYEILFLI